MYFCFVCGKEWDSYICGYGHFRYDHDVLWIAAPESIPPWGTLKCEKLNIVEYTDSWWAVSLPFNWIAT